MTPVTPFSKRVPTLFVIGAAIIAFHFGKHHQRQLQLVLQVPASTIPITTTAPTTIPAGGRKTKLEVPLAASTTQLPPINHSVYFSKPGDPTFPGPLQYDQLIAESGLLSLRPPQKPAASGNDFYSLLPFQVLSWYPRAILFPNLIDQARAQYIIDMAKKRMVKSGLALRKGESDEATKNVRTSYGTFLSRDQDHQGVLSWLEERIALASGIPASHGEAFNVLRYESNQHYDSHYDSFDEREYGTQLSQRVATVLVYLSTPEEGGETIFKLEGKENSGYVKDYTTCDTGLKYQPRQGDALLFWSAQPDGKRDWHSLHGGCPVLKGVKWDATKWIHNTPIGGPY